MYFNVQDLDLIFILFVALVWYMHLGFAMAEQFLISYSIVISYQGFVELGFRARLHSST